MTESRAKGRLQLILIGAIFLGPMLIAYVLYESVGGWTPDAGTQHGDLLRPPGSLPDVALAARESGAAPRFRGKWSLIVFSAGDCADVCQTALYETRQIHRALGHDRDRVQRFLYTASDAQNLASIESEHPELIVLARGSPASRALLEAVGDHATGDVFLADPRGNLIMRFPTGTGMRGIHEDLKKLLKISQIG